jgi:hypothetical protein
MPKSINTGKEPRNSLDRRVKPKECYGTLGKVIEFVFYVGNSLGLVSYML